MKIIVSKELSPFKNFALEELLLREENIKEDILFLYRNNNTIVIGRNQNVYEEVDLEFVKENKIVIARRVSGGGAVYQDLGNVNFAFITKKNNYSYAEFLKPVIEFLKSLGLKAEFVGKNDLVVNGFKVSGNAQYKIANRMFHHGTLLFDANLKILASALKPNKLKLASKAIKSIRQRVTNIKSLLTQELTSKEFIQKMVHFFEEQKLGQILNWNFLDLNKVDQLAQKKASENWNFQKNPPFSYKCEKRFDGGTIVVKITVEDNIVKNIVFHGDFLSSNNFENIYKFFVGASFDKLKMITAQIPNFQDYFGQLKIAEIQSLFI